MPRYRVPGNRAFYDADGRYVGGGSELDLSEAEAKELGDFVVPLDSDAPRPEDLSHPIAASHEVPPPPADPYLPGETAEEKSAAQEALGYDFGPDRPGMPASAARNLPAEKQGNVDAVVAEQVAITEAARVPNREVSNPSELKAPANERVASVGEADPDPSDARPEKEEDRKPEKRQPTVTEEKDDEPVDVSEKAQPKPRNKAQQPAENKDASQV